MGENFLNYGCTDLRPDPLSLILNHCPLCDGPDHEEIYLARDRHYGISGVYRLVRCLTCSLVFLNPMFSERELSALYPKDYYAYQEFSYSRWKNALKALLFFRTETSDPKFSSAGRMLDLGCGTGWFLASMRDKGWQTYGVEINAAAADLGRKQAGLNVFSGTLQQASFPSDFFDYVRSNHSFEHISCPGETLDEIRRILRPEGKLLIGVPNVTGLNAKFFRQYWWYLGAPVHPFAYSVQTLSKLLRKHGFLIERVNYNSDYSGILGSCQIFLNRTNGRKSTEGRVINNPFLRIPAHWLAKLVDISHLGDAIEITATKAGT
jgi:SAM-dependent methyltransferase